MKELYIKFWDNATKKVGEYKEFDNTNKIICENDIKESIRRAFRDLTVRTMQRKTAESISLDSLSEQFYEKEGHKFKDWFDIELSEENFNDTEIQKMFDTWHKEACDCVIDFLKDYYIDNHCTYGKAQKIINMSFKNLFALCVKKGIDEKYSIYFKYCHVPLDSFTLEWFVREKQRKGIKNIVKSKIANWSAICYYKDKPCDYQKYSYFFFQEKFREWLLSDDSTPLKSEFEIWTNIQKELGAEGFLFSLKEEISQTDKNKIKLMSLDEKIKEVKECLQI